MNYNLPPKVRFAVYVASGLGDILAIYLSSTGVIGEPELKLWTGISVFVKGLAAINVKEIK